jgi:hypothetical protein
VTTLRAFLRLYEARGGGEVPSRDFEAAIAEDGDGARAALRAEGIVRDAPRATTWPCDGIACARDVRELPSKGAGARRLLAVCSRDPAECEIEDVDARDLAQVTIVPDALVAMLRRVLRIDAPRASPRGPLAAAAPFDALVLLGEQAGAEGARDVFFGRRPGHAELRALFAERAESARGTWVLVPTARAVEPDLFARYGARRAEGRLALDALTDVLVVQGERVAVAPRLHVVRASAGAPEEARTTGETKARAGIARPRSAVEQLLPRARRWSEVTLYDHPDPDKVLVEIAGRAAPFTAAELGLATKRARRPTKAFRLLQTICERDGMFDTRAFGSRDASKQLLVDLRVALRGAFGIEDDPFEPYSKAHRAWKPKFRALSTSPAEARRRARELLEGG